MKKNMFVLGMLMVCMSMSFFLNARSGLNLSSGDHRIVDAAYNNNLAEVQNLIKKGADVNSTNIVGDTALINAAYHGYAKVAQVLINTPGINLEMETPNGFTALVWAVWGGHADIVEALVKAGPTHEKY